MSDAEELETLRRENEHICGLNYQLQSELDLLRAKFEKYEYAVTVTLCKGGCERGYKNREMADGVCAFCLQASNQKLKEALIKTRECLDSKNHHGYGEVWNLGNAALNESEGTCRER